MDFSRKCRMLAAGLATTGALVLAGPAQADPVSFLPADSPVQFKYNNLETLVQGIGETLNGIVNVSSINDPGGTPYWAANLSDGTALTGYFANLTVSYIANAASATPIIYFTGGDITLYNVPSGSFLPTSPADSIASQICPGGVCPAPWLTGDFAGPNALDDPTTPFDESTATLIATITAGGLASPTGTGDGQIEITGGSAASHFLDVAGAPDLSIQSNIQGCPASGTLAANCAFNDNTWPVASFDPVTGTTVPEPGTLFLMGAGLAALGFGASRRKRKATA